MAMRMKQRGPRAVVALAASLWMSACDFSVTNPGPVQDEFLSDTVAFQAIVNGMGRDLSDGLNYLAFHGSMVARELFPTGGTGQFGISPKNADGLLDIEEQGAPWTQTQRARWTASDGLRRMYGVWGARANSSNIVAQGELWAGYANRALGENMCDAVFNGGPKKPRSEFLDSAEAHFTKAIEVATAAGGATGTTIATAAKAGRASVRAFKGNWTGAVADASGIATTFAYKMPYYNRGDADEYNRIAWAGFRQPYKTHTMWGTWYADYFKTSSDARVKFIDTGVVGDGKVSCCGAVPFYQQQKHALRESPINLSTGQEMRLLEAEDQLLKGNWQTAMATINAVRASYNVTPWAAASASEAWGFLKRERGIQLYLEGRRLGDMYRWKKNNTPGALDPKETLSASSYLLAQDLCFPIPRGELDTNPNLK